MKSNPNKARKHTSAVLEQLLKKITPLEKQKVETKMLIAKRIGIYLDCANIKKSEFAQKLNKKPSVITKWLSGTHHFTTDTLEDIANGLGIKMADLISDKPNTIAQVITINTSTQIKNSAPISPSFFDINNMIPLNSKSFKRSISN
jgi:transcriptional regulator with XRE-family HTH domain